MGNGKMKRIISKAVLFRYFTDEQYYPESKLAIDRSVKIFTTPIVPGWNEFDGTWIYVNDDTIATGWQKIGNNWYYFDARGYCTNP